MPEQMRIKQSKDMWSICETQFDEHNLGKCEAIMALGNGYMGVRSATEENYFGETRNTFVAGTFNKAYENEVTELPNIPDVIQISFLINGRYFNLKNGKIIEYSRSLNFKNGELRRDILWSSAETGKVVLTFRRLISMADKHLIAQSVVIKPLERDLFVSLESGIDAQLTNSGTQHFLEGDKRLFDKEIITMLQETSESRVKVFVATIHQFYASNPAQEDQMAQEHNMFISIDRRKIFGKTSFQIKTGSSHTINKYSLICTSRDLGFESLDSDKRREHLVDKLRTIKKHSFDTLLAQSQSIWECQVWSKVAIEIESSEPFDQVAARFAQYHLQIMTPTHDKRMGIGAKGLTGEGYKGHSFWDTEIFILPYFLYTQPQVAKQLLEYRYLGLSAARQKALDNGYKGAMFPWESAWISDGEVTPIWGGADIHTGTAIKIWSGFIELHITADIAFAVFQYYSITGDEAFMEQCGYEILFDTAVFWASRLEEGADGLLHICNVVGPDEYKEHIDDNAFTNYLVHMNFELVLLYASKLKECQNSKRDLYNRLNQQFDLENITQSWAGKKDRIYLPNPNKEGIIPQDKTYLSKEIIELSSYKQGREVGAIFEDYNLSQINEIQVSKQADIMMLFYLRENLFDRATKKKNWNYYEPKTLHDSSLSLPTHAIIANDLGDYSLAYDLFTRSWQIDLSQNMKSSDHGIHAASLGGITQVLINGFGGVRIINGTLRIEPHLPQKWSSLGFVLNWRTDVLQITVKQKEFSVKRLTNNNKTIAFLAFGTSYTLDDAKENKKIISLSPS